MGQSWALEASGDSWETPYLARLLVDPYSAVRLIALRSLRQVANEEAIPFDHLGPVDQRARVSRAFTRRWARERVADGMVASPATLVEGPGRLRLDRFEELYEQRDDRWIILAE